MIIIIGLGNPGEQYKNTRHNVGFMTVDKFAERNNFVDFEIQKKFNALVSKGLLNQKEILLLKPQTFMNNSGKSAQKLVSTIKDKVEDIIVIHDDIDLPTGKIKIVKERGSAGHKGVESIIKNIGNTNLIRFRIGIGQEERTEALKIVLEGFSGLEQEKIDEAVLKSTDALNLFISDGLEKTMDRYN